MNRVVIITIASLAALTLARSASAQSPVEHGMKVYKDLKCSVCHSIAGKGNAKGKLDDVGTKLKADDIRKWITNPVEMAAAAKAERKPPMKALVKPPSKDDLDALVAYLAGLKKK